MKLTAFILLAGILGMAPPLAIPISQLTGLDILAVAFAILIASIIILTKARRKLWS